jgi:hypothetical protein
MTTTCLAYIREDFVSGHKQVISCSFVMMSKYIIDVMTSGYSVALSLTFKKFKLFFETLYQIYQKFLKSCLKIDMN